ncbi:helix-turn-helix transcriptional regulator [Saccharopolyspora cebuensis]|uniref:Helix-turn-helix transcriptional regulator n=1 Tax=Saccharopolyspora cebuensis TaxID=418759 RepID=A0ABV4CKP4_9PSEU
MELLRLREQAGKSQEEAAEWVGIRASAISKIENGRQKVNPAYLKLLLQLYGVGSPHAEALHQIAKEASERGWWVSYGSTVPSWFRDYAGMERAAAEICSYEPELVPGLLQTSTYVRALATARQPDVQADELERRIEIRKARQERVTGESPIAIKAVLNEAVVRRIVGGAAVMREQLHYLAEMSELPNISLRLLPFTAGAHASMVGAFSLLRFPEEPMNTVYVELAHDAIYIERPSDVTGYTVTFEQLADMSESEEGSRELFHQLAHDL